MKLGWLEAHTPTTRGLNTITVAEEASGEIQLYKIGDGEFNFPKDEYLLIEYRAQRGMDVDLPGEGLLIYHIDESPSVSGNTNNEGHPWQNDDWPRNGKHYRVALVQADRLYSLERGINNGGESDFFNADYINSLVPSADANAPWEGPFPNTDSYQNGAVYQTGVKIYNISSVTAADAGSSLSSSSASTMTFMFRGNPEDKPSSSSARSTMTSIFRGNPKDKLSVIDGYGNVLFPLV